MQHHVRRVGPPLAIRKVWLTRQTRPRTAYSDGEASGDCLRVRMAELFDGVELIGAGTRSCR